jgi:flagellar protein FlaI
MRAVNQPQSWWGWHGWNQPEPLSVIELMEAGTMPAKLAAVFWLGLERGASFAFAADPPSAGKTTVLTALLTFVTADTVVYFTQGWGETFDLPLPDGDHPTYLMVNEMSDDLPVYSWGPYVVHIFELMGKGYSMCTTMHADTVEEVVEQLEGEGVPREQLAELTFVVPLAIARRGGRVLRRVGEVGLLGAGEGGLTVRRIAAWDERHDTFSVLEDAEDRSAVAERLGMDSDDLDRELARRQAFLERLLADGIDGIRSVQKAVEDFRGEVD